MWEKTPLASTQGKMLLASDREKNQHLSKRAPVNGAKRGNITAAKWNVGRG